MGSSTKGSGQSSAFGRFNLRDIAQAAGHVVQGASAIANSLQNPSFATPTQMPALMAANALSPMRQFNNGVGFIYAPKADAERFNREGIQGEWTNAMGQGASQPIFMNPDLMTEYRMAKGDSHLARVPVMVSMKNPLILDQSGFDRMVSDTSARRSQLIREIRGTASQRLSRNIANAGRAFKRAVTPGIMYHVNPGLAAKQAALPENPQAFNKIGPFHTDIGAAFNQSTLPRLITYQVLQGGHDGLILTGYKNARIGRTYVGTQNIALPMGPAANRDGTLRVLKSSGPLEQGIGSFAKLLASGQHQQVLAGARDRVQGLFNSATEGPIANPSAAHRAGHALGNIAGRLTTGDETELE